MNQLYFSLNEPSFIVRPESQQSLKQTLIKVDGFKLSVSKSYDCLSHGSNDNNKRLSYATSISPLLTHLRVDEEADPRDDDEEPRGEVVGDDVEGDLPGQHHLEAGHAVVHAQGHVVGLVGPEVVDLDLVVQDGLDGILLVGHELVGEDHLRHVVVEAADLEL